MRANVFWVFASCSAGAQFLAGSASGQAAPDLDVSIGLLAERGEATRGYSGYVALTVPFERLAAPRRLTEALAAEPEQPAGPEGSPGAPATAPQANPDSAESESEPAPALPPAVLARLARDAVTAALRTHRVAEARRELDSLASRSRSSAWLPELRLRGSRSNDESLRLSPTLDDPDRYTLDGGTDFVLEAALTWKLGRLVFADQEIPIERLRIERGRAVERLTARVVELVLAWHRALSNLPHVDEKQSLKLELEALGAAVELELLTGGWFGERSSRELRPRPTRAE